MYYAVPFQLGRNGYCMYTVGGCPLQPHNNKQTHSMLTKPLVGSTMVGNNVEIKALVDVQLEQ